MFKKIFLFFAVFSILPLSACAGMKPAHYYKIALSDDYRSFYSYNSAFRLVLASAGGGVLANSSADREFREYFRDDVRSRSTDNIADFMRLPGEAATIPLYAGAILLFDEGTNANIWGERTLRALLVGGPVGLVMQRATGGGRPREGDSHWRPFRNNNGLSGHAFIGAVPFLTAAKMSHGPYMKTALYAASTFAGLSRINDDEHYLSQALLGWYLAYLSVGAVSEDKRGETVLFITPFKDGFAVRFEALF